MGFWERSKGMLTKSIKSTKEVIEGAADKSKELGEKGVAKVTIMQLEKQAENRFAQIGRNVYDLLIKKGQQTVSKGTDEIAELLEQVQKIEKEIDGFEEML